MNETSREKTLPAITWARQIAGPLMSVAAHYQLSAAREILSPASAIEYQDARIVPFGPTLRALREMLAEEREAAIEEAEDAGHPETWPSWTTVPIELA